MKRPFICDRESLVRRIAQVEQYASELMRSTGDEKGALITVQEYEQTRSLEQNDKMWAMLTDIANQVEWPVDGRKRKLPPEDWKDILTAGLKSSTRIAQGIDGGFVVLGQHTSKMTVGKMRELIELIGFFGDRENVIWSGKK